MIAGMIKRKASMPHDLIREEMRAAPIVTRPLFQLVIDIMQEIWELLKLLKIGTYVIKPLVEHGDN